MRIIFILLLMTLMAFSLKAQKTPDEIISSFFKTYENRPDDAVRSLIASKWIDENSIEQLISKLWDGVLLMGTYYGYDKISEKEISESYKIYYYLVKYERQPVRFIFNFYKPQSEWLVYSFSFDESFNEK